MVIRGSDIVGRRSINDIQYTIHDNKKTLLVKRGFHS
jgi:hypothetical protein